MKDTEPHDFAADQLRESEARFRAFALASSDVLYRMSSDWSVMQQLDGVGFLADTTGPNRGWLLDYIPIDEQARVTAEVDGAIQAKSVFELEHRVVRADGTTGWTLSRAVPILDETGCVKEWIGSAKDVTVRRRIEEDLRRSEDLRRLAIAGGRMGVWRWNLHDDVIWGDAAFLSLWGYPASDEPRRLSDFADRMSPQGRVEMGEMVTRAIAAGEEFDGQLAVVSGPTNGQWVRWRGRAEEKQPWIVNGVSFDVTDQRLRDERLRESETRHRLLIDSWSQAVWETDAHGIVVADSPSWRAYTGQTFEQWLGYGWLDAIHLDDRAYAEQQWREAIAVHGLVDADFRLRAPDGSWRWTNVRAAPVLDERGWVEKWAGMNIDIEARKRATERQDVLVAELQHRTRNLIAVVESIASDTMRETGPTEAFRSTFSDRLSALSRVQGLLSRSEAEPITFRALLRLELDALGAGGVGDRITIAGPEIYLRPSTVQTLALALHELATNARKYGALSHEGGHLTVMWRKRVEAGERRIAIEWAETGLEQAPEQPTSKRKDGGYGRELIEQALPHALGARTSYALSASGVRCTIDLAVRPGKGKP